MSVPKLRFKEFDGAWSIKPLKNICKINQGLQIAIENRFTDDGVNRYFYITNEFLREGAKKTYFIENPPRNVICEALLHKDLKCKAPLIEPNLRRNLGKWST
ncbi:hypothetical protein ACQUFW_04330 [Acinetobacter johnsonii]|uniref:hypothetical protein n=1 Tax=Acinetobacter johnsonii TaxID=40214 RepID=UPI003D17C84B